MNGTSLHRAIGQVAKAVFPLVVETGHSEYPITIGGTIFLVGFRNQVHAVSSRHALSSKDMRRPRIFVREGSRQTIPITTVHYANHLVPDDYADIALIRVDLQAALKQHARRATLVDLDRTRPDWNEYKDTSRFVVVGFPDQHAEVDYARRAVVGERHALHGRYGGPSEQKFVHKLLLEDTEELTSFSGFSGGPVFTWVNRIGQPSLLSLCGVAIQGTAGSKLIRFIEVSILMSTLETWGADAA